MIIVAALADAETKNRCLAAGANAYRVKPVERALLARTVRERLEARIETPPRRA